MKNTAVNVKNASYYIKNDDYRKELLDKYEYETHPMMYLPLTTLGAGAGAFLGRAIGKNKAYTALGGLLGAGTGFVTSSLKNELLDAYEKDISDERSDGKISLNQLHSVTPGFSGGVMGSTLSLPLAFLAYKHGKHKGHPAIGLGAALGIGGTGVAAGTALGSLFGDIKERSYEKKKRREEEAMKQANDSYTSYHREDKNENINHNNNNNNTNTFRIGHIDDLGRAIKRSARALATLLATTGGAAMGGGFGAGAGYALGGHYNKSPAKGALFGGGLGIPIGALLAYQLAKYRKPEEEKTAALKKLANHVPYTTARRLSQRSQNTLQKLARAR